MRDKGKLVAWNDEKGYGFIAPFSGAAQVFIHVKAFGYRTRRPEVHDVVTYTLSSDKQGRRRAVKATLAGASRSPRAKPTGSAAALFGVTIFLAVVGAAVLLGYLLPLALVVYPAASAVTFGAYAIDKSAAQKGRRRTSEKALHLLSLIGGWPGAWVAQSVLRHKSRKQPFRTVFWLTVMLNCAAVAWLSTPGGRATLDSLSG
jgi:uncharacterized membrane protein YsdA (DUF1294 family)/cold shock CspA family protein